VLFTKEAIDPTRLRDKVVIALDILFATTTLAHVLAEGAVDVRLAHGEEDAYRLEAEVEAPLLDTLDVVPVLGEGQLIGRVI
jgi:2-phosphosulfolactate phosphatase